MNTERILPPDQATCWAHASLVDPLALSFSRHVAANVDWTKAIFRVFAEESVSDDALLKFETGSKVSPEPHPDGWLDERIKSVGAGRSAFLIAEDWTVRPQHSFLTARAMPAVFHNEEVYYVVRLQEVAHEMNWRRILSNTVPLFHAFVIGGECGVSPRDTIGQLLMEKWSKQLQMIIFGVFDGETYLVSSFSDSG